MANLQYMGHLNIRPFPLICLQFQFTETHDGKSFSTPAKFTLSSHLSWIKSASFHTFQVCYHMVEQRGQQQWVLPCPIAYTLTPALLHWHFCFSLEPKVTGSMESVLKVHAVWQLLSQARPCPYLIFLQLSHLLWHSLCFIHIFCNCVMAGNHIHPAHIPQDLLPEHQPQMNDKCWKRKTIAFIWRVVTSQN